MLKHLFFLLLIHPIFASYPVLYEGRFRPIEAAESLAKSDFYELDVKQQPTTLETDLLHQLLTLPSPLKVLPIRMLPGEWVPLQALNLDTPNFTPYSNDLFKKLQTAYRGNDRETVESLLSEGYQSLAGKTYRGQLHYPHVWQLQLEAALYNYPLTEIAIGLYALGLIALFFGRSAFWLLPPFLVHTALLLARSLILERPPVSNMFETVIYVPWITLLSAFVLHFIRPSSVLMISGALANLILLLVIKVTGVSDGLENVQAVLDSQFWLLIHVLMVVGSYGVFILAGIMGHLYLIRPRKELSAQVLRALYLGCALLIPGTILGGIWAAQSWGRFWDWDPKESWAFITACIYLVVIHSYRFGKVGQRGLAIGSIVGLIAVSFTWYGVNYILGTGLHSYGFGEGGLQWYYAYLAAEALFLIAFGRKALADLKSS